MVEPVSRCPVRISINLFVICEKLLEMYTNNVKTQKKSVSEWSLTIVAMDIQLEQDYIQKFANIHGWNSGNVRCAWNVIGFELCGFFFENLSHNRIQSEFHVNQMIYRSYGIKKNTFLPYFPSFPATFSNCLSEQTLFGLLRKIKKNRSGRSQAMRWSTNTVQFLFI